MPPNNIISRALQYVTSRESFPELEKDEGGHALPFIASPVDPEAYAWLRERSKAYATDPLVPGKIKRSLTVEHYEVQQGTDSKLAKAIFRKQHEASSIELFFDLFFVGNLAIFTSVHAHIDAISVANYIGFFSILWTTWFHVVIYDVRFYTDCILARLFKILCFLVMVSFTGLAPIYKTINDGGSSRAFTGMALVMMSLRFIMAIQYAIVFFFVHGFHKTFVPLLVTIVIYLATGFGFLAIFLMDRSIQLDDAMGTAHINKWYIILAVEMVAVVIVNAIWRVLSFKHTHVVERAGLLTLIVIGEGIIGLTKSSAYDLLGRNASVWTEAGLMVAGVILLYFIYVLYFNQIEHDHCEERWGTIRQQIWVLGHYFLHIAILLTVEGQTALITWNSCRRGINWFMSNYPSIRNPGAEMSSNDELVRAVNTSLTMIKDRFYYYNFTDYYDPTSDLAALQNNSINPFNSSIWNSTASGIVSKIRWEAQYYIFVNFQAEGPKEIDYTSDAELKVFLYNQSFKVIFEYFYIGAGALLLVLAAMAWFGKNDKRKDEYLSIAVRILAGLGLPFMSLVAFLETPGDMNSFRYRGLQWFIPIVVYTYLAVLMADSLVKILFSIRRRQNAHHPVDRHLVDGETGYKTAPTMMQTHPKTIQFEHDSSAKRTDSDETGTTVAGDDGQEYVEGKKYNTLTQYETIDKAELERDRDIEHATVHRDFSFEAQPLTGGRPDRL